MITGCSCLCIGLRTELQDSLRNNSELFTEQKKNNFLNFQTLNLLMLGHLIHNIRIIVLVLCPP
jgi:hypothetical protein